MGFLSLLISSISLSLGDGDGWFPVEKAPKVEEAVADIDPSIWVLFSKRVGSETVWVRFPEDPKAFKTESGDLIFRSEKGGEIFELVVQSVSEVSQNSDFDFQEDGKWVHEHLAETDYHIYHLRTQSVLSDSPNHAAFVSSFSYSEN